MTPQGDAPAVQPLTPADCDLRDFEFMPLSVVRLRDSDMAALQSPEECWAAVLLWSAAWHQVPAASLPDDDRVLSVLAGYGRVVKEWMRVRAGALRGFVRCADGRLYHPVVAEKAREAWESKLRRMHATECSRIHMRNKRQNTITPAPSFAEFMVNRLWITSNSDATTAANAAVLVEHRPMFNEQGALSHATTHRNRPNIEGKGQGQGYINPPTPFPDRPPGPPAVTATGPPLAVPMAPLPPGVTPISAAFGGLR
jgi:hypothetical protein